MGVITSPSGIKTVAKIRIWSSLVSKSETKFTKILIEQIQIEKRKVNIKYVERLACIG